MRAVSVVKLACITASFGVLAFVALSSSSAPAEGQSVMLQDGKAGFVVSDISYVFSHDAGETGACPQGMTTNGALAGLFGGGQQANRPQAQAQGTQDEAQRQAFRQLTADPARNPCLNPQAAPPDADFRYVTGRNVAVTGGINLDGQDSRANARAAPGTCAHDDFRSFDGARGIDNQWFRAVGCISGYQPGGPANTFAFEMLTGSWGILITLSGVDDLRNDNDVEVGIYSNADPIQLSPSREPLRNASYAAEQNPRFRATARGRIVDGVLTTNPTDVRLHMIAGGMYLERHLRDARLRMTLTSDGALDGIMAGYTPVDEMYDMTFGFRTATTASGEPSPLRGGSAMGRAATLGYTCQGVYQSLVENADGHRDPATGRCTSLSTQYHVRAIPAFVVETQTSSVNGDLEATSDGRIR